GAGLVTPVVLIAFVTAAVAPPVKSSSAAHVPDAGPPALICVLDGGGGGGPDPPDRISMPLTWALSFTAANWRVIVPPLGTVTENCETTALYSPPAAAKISKLVSTWVPSMNTLNTRDPAVVQYSSAKCSRIVSVAPAV